MKDDSGGMKIGGGGFPEDIFCTTRVPPSYSTKVFSQDGFMWLGNDSTATWECETHGMITFDAMRRTSIYAGSGNTQDVSFNAAGQVIGQVKQIESVKDVIYRIINEYLDSVERLNSLLPEE